MMEYSVKLDAFEGPLDLLLHLIQRYEIDIYDIPVAEITEQYLRYIHTMQVLQLDIASEYLVMAATLLELKSRMLLPNHEDELEMDAEQFDSVDDEDPREELVKRLIEYRKFKAAAQQLQHFEKERSLMYTKPPENLQRYLKKKEITPVTNVTIYDMLSALQTLFQRKKLLEPRTTTVHKQEIPIEKRMDEILTELTNANGAISFYSLFPYREKGHIVVTFLSILELMKINEIYCEQTENFGEIMIYKRKGVFTVGS